MPISKTLVHQSRSADVLICMRTSLGWNGKKKGRVPLGFQANCSWLQRKVQSHSNLWERRQWPRKAESHPEIGEVKRHVPWLWHCWPFSGRSTFKYWAGEWGALLLPSYPVPGTLVPHPQWRQLLKEQGGFLETLKELCKRGVGRSLSHLEEPSLRKQHQCMQASGESSERSRLQTTRSKERSEIQLWHRPQGFSRDEADVATDVATVSDRVWG